MPTLSQLTASTVVKLLLCGDSKTGKTGAKASLVKAGYKIRMLDYDNGWEPLAAAIERTCPDLLDNVEIVPFRDRYKATPAGPMLDGLPKAFVEGIKLLDKWTDGSNPKDWGPEYILDLDSFSFFCDAAYNWADAMNPSAKDKRQIYGAAQEAAEHVLALLTSPAFNTNVIVNAHIKYMDMPDGAKRGYPVAIGSALSPTIPRYFNSMAQCVTGPGGKRTIQTVSTPLMDLANPKSFVMEKSLPIETGLATFFEILRGKPTWTTRQPTSNSSPVSSISPPSTKPSAPAKTPLRPQMRSSTALKI